MAGASNVASLDKVINREVKKRVGEQVTIAANQMREELDLPPVDEEDEEEEGQFTVSPGSQTQSKKQTAKAMFNSFPSSEGWYGKVWKVRPEGGWEPKEYEITAPETIPDLEQFIVQLVHEKGWGDGKYQVHVRNYDTKKQKGFVFNQPIYVGDYTPEEKVEREKTKRFVPHASPTTLASDQVDSSLKIVDKILGERAVIRAENGPGMNVVEVMKANTDAIKTGMEFNKDKALPPDPTASMLQVINALREILKPPEPIKQPTLVETLTTLKELGIVAQPKNKEDEVTMLEKLKLLKDGLGLKYAHEVENPKTDPLSMVSKVGELVSALRPLISPEVAPASTFQIIMEAVSKFGGPLFETIKDFASAKKMEVEYRISQLGGPAPAQIVRRNPPPQIQTDQSGGQPVNQNVLLSQIASIVQSRDESKFPFLQETIYGFLGPHWIDGLISGKISVDYIVTMSKVQFGDAFNNEPSKLYLHKFVSWLRAQQGKPSQGKIPSDETIYAVCEKCGIEWEIPKAEWEENLTCERCNAKLSIVNSQGALPPISTA